MIHLRTLPPQYTYLSGLLDIFKSKIGPNLSSPVRVSAHFFYTMNIWHPDFTYETELLDVLDYLKQAKLSGTKYTAQTTTELKPWDEFHSFTSLLPFGCIDDPFSSLNLVVGWPHLTEDAVVDTASYSDLEPDQAPEWYFGVKPNSKIDFRLHELLDGFWKLSSETRTIEEILGKKLANDGSNSENSYNFIDEKMCVCYLQFI
jgi:Rab3 GTPase-activating protein catalytic subunit